MQLAQRLKNLEAVEFDQVAVERRNRSNDLFGQPRNADNSLVEHYSLDKRFLMIHPSNLKKLTPILRAP